MKQIIAILKNPANIFWPLFLVAFLFYQKSVFDLYLLWTNSNIPTYNHGLLLFAICIVFLIKKWNENSAIIRLQPEWRGYVFLASSSLLWFLACLGNVQIIEHIAFISLLAALVWAVLGIETAKYLAFPILLLLMATTVWDIFSFFLQYIAAYGAGVGLNFSGIPTLIEGTYLHIPEGIFHVEGGCSGLGQFVVAVTIALIYSNITRLKVIAGFVVVIFSILVAIISNTIRIYIVVVAGHLTNMQHTFVTDHYNLGWIVFGINIFLFLLLIDHFFIKSGRVTQRFESRIHFVKKGQVKVKNEKPSCRYVGAIFISAVFVMSLGPSLAVVYKHNLDAEPALVDGFNQNNILPGSMEWKVAEGLRNVWQPVTKGSDLSVTNLYKSDKNQVVSYSRNIYRYQSQGKEAVQYGNYPYDNRMWRLLSRQKLTAGSFRGYGQGVKESKIQSIYGNSNKKLVWQWYDVMGFVINNDFVAKGLNILGILIGQPDIAYIAIATDLDTLIEEDDADATSKARNTLTLFFDQLHSAAKT